MLVFAFHEFKCFQAVVRFWISKEHRNIVYNIQLYNLLYASPFQGFCVGTYNSDLRWGQVLRVVALSIFMINFLASLILLFISVSEYCSSVGVVLRS